MATFPLEQFFPPQETALGSRPNSVQLFADPALQLSAWTKNSYGHAFAHLSWLGPRWRLVSPERMPTLTPEEESVTKILTYYRCR